MRPLEEIAREAANEVWALLREHGGSSSSPNFCPTILSALTEATREQEAKVRQLQESLLDITEASCKKNAESEAQVAELREQLHDCLLLKAQPYTLAKPVITKP